MPILPKDLILRLTDLNWQYCETQDDKEEAICNFLSDSYGFCVCSYQYEIFGNEICITDIVWDTKD